MKTRLAMIMPLLAVALAAVAMACGDDNEEPGRSPASPTTGAGPTETTNTTTATRTAPATVAPSAAPGPTGIGPLDTTLLLMVTRDADRIMPRVTLTEMACATNPQGGGAPPRCEAGEANGTKVKVFPWATCQGEYARQAVVRDLIATTIKPLTLSPMTVVKIEGVTQLGYQPGDKYGLIYTDPTPGAGAVMMAVNEAGQITRIYRGCTAPADELIARAGGKAAIIFPK